MKVQDALEQAYKNGYDAAKKHGHWVELSSGLRHCSICKTIQPYGLDDYEDVQFWTCNYCPNCGAKMEDK